MSFGRLPTDGTSRSGLDRAPCSMRGRFRFSMLATIAMLASGTALAQAQPVTAQAEQLFRDGKRLMSEGNITAACDAFDGSYRMAPAVSTLLNLADCRERNQQYASAWTHFIEAARESRDDPSLVALSQTAQRRAATVESRLSYLIINVPDEARIDGLTITRNGSPVDPAEWNRDMPVDGGEYRIEGKAPAFEPWSTTVKVGNAKDKQSVNVPRFREALADTPSSSVSTGVDADRPRMRGGKRKLAIGLWAVGAVALGGGLALELSARDTYDDAKLDHDNDRRHELTGSANRRRHYAQAVGAAGLVAVGVGAVLWYRGAPSVRRVALAPYISADLAEVALVGHF